jgi:hypothetical protein
MGSSSLISTYLGNGTSAYSGDGGSAGSASISALASTEDNSSVCWGGGGDAVCEFYPGSAFATGQDGIAADSAGDLALADTSNDVVRFVPVNSGTYFGQTMIGGYVYTIAGNGTAGYSGDTGVATSAELNQPRYVAFDQAGDLYISDNQGGVGVDRSDHDGRGRWQHAVQRQ